MSVFDKETFDILVAEMLFWYSEIDYFIFDAKETSESQKVLDELVTRSELAKHELEEYVKSISK